MNSKDRANLIKRISTIEGLTDNERSALLGLLRENKSYGLVWEDKPEDIEERLRDELPILTEVPERAIISEDKDAPNHILIEGDNLETLATLAYTHEGKIDIIYIDPPYNTGNKDFIYNDSYVDKEDSYRHSKWLSFMSRRLKIAKKLLSDRGVIFISIDDNEQAQLKLLCDETFGENNFLSEIMWHKNYASANDSKTFSKVLDYILAYRKTDKFIRNLLPRTEKQNTLYKYDSNDGKGKWRSDNLSVRTYSANYDFPIVNPITGVEYNPPKGRSWMTNKERIQEWITETRVYFGLNGKGAPQLKRYLSEVQQGVVPTTYWSYDDCGHNDEARKEIKDIFGQPPFDSPKPTRLLKQILRLGSNNESIILDFFAGSGTTLHATMQLNSSSVIGGSIENVDWGNVECVQNLLWNILVIHRYCTPNYNHAYVFSTLKEADEIVKAIFGDENVNKISGNCVFRVFHDVRRFAIVNFGGRKARMGNVSFKSYYGKDVQEGISMTEQKQLTANNLFGNGYRNGERISVGCSVKGKIWSHTRGNLLEYTKWTRMIGMLVEDENIDPDSFIKNTLRVHSISELPQIMPIAIDWDPELYRDYPEHGIYLTYNTIDYQLWYATIELTEYEIRNYITFNIIIDNFKFTYIIEYYEKNNHKTYHVKQISGDRLRMRYGTRIYNDICDYFNNNDAVPVIYFADGSCLYANNLVCVNSDIIPFSQENLIGIDWADTKIENESQHVEPYETDSVQYFFSKYIWDKFDLIYDDDGSGEIADLIGFKNENNAIHIHLFHLKYAHEGRVSNMISNFYEVCGQAQKCLKWNDRDKSRQLFNRLFARKIKKYQGRECSRILKGSEEELEQLSSQVNWKKDLIMHINIVQPGLSSSNPSQDILNLLGCVASYIKDVSNIDLHVYCNL